MRTAERWLPRGVASAPTSPKPAADRDCGKPSIRPGKHEARLSRGGQDAEQVAIAHYALSRAQRRLMQIRLSKRDPGAWSLIRQRHHGPEVRVGRLHAEPGQRRVHLSAMVDLVSEDVHHQKRV